MGFWLTITERLVLSAAVNVSGTQTVQYWFLPVRKLLQFVRSRYQMLALALATLGTLGELYVTGNAVGDVLS